VTLDLVAEFVLASTAIAYGEVVRIEILKGFLGHWKKSPLRIFY
jgi:hypothetical protein